MQVHERESIAVDGKPLTRPALDSALHEVQAAAASVGHGGSECGSLTSFEALTAAGFLTFSRSVDIAVMEVGVGGLHDATNVISDPAVCAITSVSLDHQDLLGDNIAEIARVKAGIFKSACPAVVGPVDPEAARAITEYAEHVGAGSLTWTRPATASDDRAGWASYRGLSFPLPLKGQFQFSNVAVALDVLHVLRSSSTVNCSDEQIVEGVRSVVWPGRLEWVPWPLSCHSLSSGPSHVASELSRTRVLVDGAHNLAAAVSLRNFIDFELADKKRKMLWPCRQPVAWIIAMSAGKDAAGILQALLRRGDSVFFVPFEVILSLSLRNQLPRAILSLHFVLPINKMLCACGYVCARTLPRSHRSPCRGCVR